MKTKTIKTYVLCFFLTIFITVTCLLGLSYQFADTASAAESSDLGFVFDSGTNGYKVKALNKNLTEAIIPEIYNGYPVTGVDDNGFTNCTALERVVIPRSVISIGNNAFMRCTNLKKVMGLSQVEIIGSNVFSMCSNLEYFILPKSVQTIGTSMLRDADCVLYARMDENELSALGTTWSSGFLGEIVYGNELVYDEYENEEGEQGLSLVSWQNIDSDEQTTILIETWIEDANNAKGGKIDGKLLNIEEYAFVGCIGKELIIRHPQNSNYDHTINVESFAFAISYFDSITIEADISFPKDSEAQFSNTTSMSITLPDSISVIPKSAFVDCNVLEDLRFLDGKAEKNHLSDKITRIESQAFSSCYAINKFYISNTIEYIGHDAFSFWGLLGEQEINIDLPKAGINWDHAWNNGVESGCYIVFTGVEQYTIKLVVEQDGVLEATGSTTLYVKPRTVLSDYVFDYPESTSHDFTGVWYTTPNRDSGSEFDIDTPIRENLTLYAGWTKKIFAISFSENKCLTFLSIDGQVLSGSTIYVPYGDWCQFSYMLNPGYSDPSLRYGARVLYEAEDNTYLFTVYNDGTISVTEYQLITYRISYVLDNNANNPSSNPTEYTVEDLPLSIKAPIWDAYINSSWQVTKQSNGQQITDSTIIPEGAYGNIELTATWNTPKKYHVYFNYGEGEEYKNYIDTPYKDYIEFDIETPTFTLLVPTWEPFLNCAWDIPTIYQGTWKDITVTALWSIPREYAITYANLREGTKGANNKDTYTIRDLPLKLDDPSWSKAYDSGKWNVPTVTGLTLRSITVTAVWSDPVQYSITYENLRYGTKGANNKNTYTIEDLPLKLDNPIWSQAYNKGEWIVPSVTETTLRNITVTAVWSNPVSYTITYANLQGGTKGANNKSTYTIEDLPLKLDNPSWPVAYESGYWDVPEVSVPTLRDIQVKAVWGEYVYYEITYGFEPDIEFWVYAPELPVTRSRPIYPAGENKKIITHFDSYEFEWIPFKTGYMGVWDIDSIKQGTDRNLTVTFHWEPITYEVHILYVDLQYVGYQITPYDDTGTLHSAIHTSMSYEEMKSWYPISIDGYYIYQMIVNYIDNGYYQEIYQYMNDVEYDHVTLYNARDFINQRVTIAFVYEENKCITDNTLITLADGSQKAIEELTGNEMLLAWNLFTGTFDVAPILFIDKEPAREYEVIRLFFSDGTDVGVISEHGFWDFDLNKYVYLGKDAAQYIGHWFNKQTIDENGQLTWTKVQLTDVTITQEYTAAWSPVTYGHLCYYVNGMLSMPGGIGGLFNIFEVNSKTLKYDEAAMQADIERYGLFTYEEFAEILPVPLEMFEAVNGQYLKVAIGKGLIDFETLAKLVERYAVFFMNM